MPQRWIVERSFGWMNTYRRLSKDYEGHVKLSRSWVLWAMIDIRNLVRWNAMAMVVRAGKASDGVGGHISTFASSATHPEVSKCHLFKGKDHPDGGDQIFFQGHIA